MQDKESVQTQDSVFSPVFKHRLLFAESTLWKLEKSIHSSRFSIALSVQTKWLLQAIPVFHRMKVTLKETQRMTAVFVPTN